MYVHAKHMSSYIHAYVIAHVACVALCCVYRTTKRQARTGALIFNGIGMNAMCGFDGAQHTTTTIGARLLFRVCVCYMFVSAVDCLLSVCALPLLVFAERSSNFICSIDRGASTFVVCRLFSWCCWFTKTISKHR